MASMSIEQLRTALPGLGGSTVSTRSYPEPLNLSNSQDAPAPATPTYSPPPPPPPPKDSPKLAIQPQYRSMLDVTDALPKHKGGQSSSTYTVEAVTPTAEPQVQRSSRSGSKDTLETPQINESDSKRMSAPPELDTKTGDVSKSPILLRDTATPQSSSPAPILTRKESNKLTRKPTDPTMSVGGAASSPSDGTPQRGNFIKRVGSYLKRTNSRGQSGGDSMLDANAPTSTPSAASTISNASSNTRGHHAVYHSSRSSTTSRSITPPSPDSPSSTIHEDQSEHTTHQEERDAFGHGHSQSTTSMIKPLPPRAGITWGPNFSEDGQLVVEPPRRHRSVSQDQLSLLRPNASDGQGAPVELMATFSFKSVEGAGLKSRRLSTCLPDEFYVDCCELDNEFRSSSFFPGRRGQTVGKGATATVKLMFRKNDPNNVFYAVKEFRRRDREEVEAEYVKKVKSEYSIAKSLHHPNIVETIQLCTHHGRWNHVMEYCQQGEMYSLVERGLFRSHYKLQDRLCFFKQLLRGVDYLHCHGIAHRDIKLENLLMNNDGYVKITDFGVSEVFCGEHPGLRTTGGECGKNMSGLIRRCAPGICGSLPYIAPEVLEKNGEYDPRPLDVWSCAIVYLTMTYGGSPWSAARMTDPNYSRFRQGWGDWLEKHPEDSINDGPGGAPVCGPIFSPERIGSPALKRLILKMLHPNPDHRAGIHEIITSSVVKGIECCSPESYEDGECCIDASTGKWIAAGSSENMKKKAIMRKHSHLPPKEHKTPKAFQHRFDMGDGWN